MKKLFYVILFLSSFVLAQEKVKPNILIFIADDVRQDFGVMETRKLVCQILINFLKKD